MSTQSKLRRDEVRRQKSEHSEPLLKRWRERVGLGAPAVALGFFVLGTIIILHGSPPFPYSEGQEVRGPLFARVGFKVIDQTETEIAQERERQIVPNYYRFNEALVARITGTIRTVYVSAQVESFEAYQLKHQEAQAAEGGEVAEWRLDEAAFDEFNRLAGEDGEDGQQRLASWIETLEGYLGHGRLVRAGDVDNRDPASLSNSAILIGGLPNLHDLEIEPGQLKVDKTTLDNFSDTNLARVEQEADRLAADPDMFTDALRPLIRKLLLETLQEEPLYKFDLEYTMKRMEDQAGSIEEVTHIYPANSLLAWNVDIEKDGGLYRLNHAQVELLGYEHDKYIELSTWPMEEIEVEERAFAKRLRQGIDVQNIGLSALLLLVIIGMTAYCAMFQTRVLHNPVRALSVALLMLIMMAASRALLVLGPAVTYPTMLVAPVVMTAAILTMVYSQRFAIGMTAALALLVVLTVRGDLGLLVVLCVSMAVVIYQLREIRGRNELFSTGLLNGLAAFIVATVVGLVAGHSLPAAVQDGTVAAISAVLAIAIFFLILSPVERIFKVATNWTLLELLDTSRALLSRLAQEAPGTYNHSLWLSAMAEDACETVGANGLLAKVGAMYHDIGKIHKAEYFAENQQSQINRHDKLAPTMSLLVIVGHVKDGVEMAKEYGLPPAVIRFIQEHHGTTVVRYFHHAASEQQKASGVGREISESEFRYPGPKPQSKETAVLMLCDGVEGAVRALPEPTAGRIENVVHTVLMDRLQDGQFDDCDITLKELHKVEESLVKSLCRFYHSRVPYPKAEPQTGTHA